MCPSPTPTPNKKTVRFADHYEEKIFSSENIPPLIGSEIQFYSQHKQKIKAAKEDHKLSESWQHIYYRVIEFIQRLQGMSYETLTTEVKDFQVYVDAYLPRGSMKGTHVDMKREDIKELNDLYKSRLMISQSKSIYLAIINGVEQDIRRTDPNFNILSLLPNRNPNLTQVSQLSMTQLIALYGVIHQRARQKRGFIASFRNKKELIDRKVFMQLADGECRKTKNTSLHVFYQRVEKEGVRYIQCAVTESTETLTWNISVINADCIASILPAVVEKAVEIQQKITARYKEKAHSFDKKLRDKVRALLSLEEDEQYKQIEEKRRLLVPYMESFEQLRVDCETLERELIKLSRKSQTIFGDIPNHSVDSLPQQIRELETIANELWEISESYNQKGTRDVKTFYLQRLKRYWSVTTQAWKLHYNISAQLVKVIDQYIGQLQAVKIAAWNRELEGRQRELLSRCNQIKTQCEEFKLSLSKQYSSCRQAMQDPSFSEYMRQVHQGDVLSHLQRSLEKCKNLPKYSYAFAGFASDWRLKNIQVDIGEFQQAAEQLRKAVQTGRLENPIEREPDLLRCKRSDLI